MQWCQYVATVSTLIAHQDIFHFCRPKTMARHIQNVIHSASDLVVAPWVSVSTISRVIHTYTQPG